MAILAVVGRVALGRGRSSPSKLTSISWKDGQVFEQNSCSVVIPDAHGLESRPDKTDFREIASSLWDTRLILDGDARNDGKRV